VISFAGLLHNWGIGLLSLGTHCPAGEGVRGVMALTQAAERLTASAAFNRGDPAPLNGLGDVRMAQAEQAVDAAAKGEAAKAALEQGYTPALAINDTNTDALVGMAEAHLLLRSLEAGQQGRGDAARSHAATAANAYRSALSQHRPGQPSPLGLFAERCDVRYNFACAAVHCGREQEAAQVLRGLISLGHTSPQELSADEDFHAVRDQPWLQQLLQMPAV